MPPNSSGKMQNMDICDVFRAVAARENNSTWLIKNNLFISIQSPTTNMLPCQQKCTVLLYHSEVLDATISHDFMFISDTSFMVCVWIQWSVYHTMLFGHRNNKQKFC